MTDLSLLNSDKKEVIALKTKHLRTALSNDKIALDGSAIIPNITVRNLGIVFTQDFSFDAHIKQFSKPNIFTCVTLKNMQKEIAHDSLTSA